MIYIDLIFPEVWTAPTKSEITAWSWVYDSINNFNKMLQNNDHKNSVH